MTGTTNNDLQRTLGRVEEANRHMEQRMDRLEKLVTEGFDKIDKSLSEMKAREQERKGAWKVIVAGSAAVGGVVAALVKYLLS